MSDSRFDGAFGALPMNIKEILMKCEKEKAINQISADHLRTFLVRTMISKQRDPQPLINLYGSFLGPGRICRVVTKHVEGQIEKFRNFGIAPLIHHDSGLVPVGSAVAQRSTNCKEDPTEYTVSEMPGVLKDEKTGANVATNGTIRWLRSVMYSFHRSANREKVDQFKNRLIELFGPDIIDRVINEHLAKRYAEMLKTDEPAESAEADKPEGDGSEEAERLRQLMHRLQWSDVPGRTGVEEQGEGLSIVTIVWVREQLMAMAKHKLNPDPFLLRTRQMFGDEQMKRVLTYMTKQKSDELKEALKESGITDVLQIDAILKPQGAKDDSKLPTNLAMKMNGKLPLLGLNLSALQMRGNSYPATYAPRPLMRSAFPPSIFSNMRPRWELSEEEGWPGGHSAAFQPTTFGPSPTFAPSLPSRRFRPIFDIVPAPMPFDTIESSHPGPLPIDCGGYGEMEGESMGRLGFHHARMAKLARDAAAITKAAKEELAAFRQAMPVRSRVSPTPRSALLPADNSKCLNNGIGDVSGSVFGIGSSAYEPFKPSSIKPKPLFAENYDEYQAPPSLKKPRPLLAEDYEDPAPPSPKRPRPLLDEGYGVSSRSAFGMHPGMHASTFEPTQGLPLQKRPRPLLKLGRKSDTADMPPPKPLFEPMTDFASDELDRSKTRSQRTPYGF